MRVFYSLFLALLIFSGVSVHARNPLRNGIYRASLARPDGKEVVFNFNVKDSAGRKVLYVFNAAERLLVDSISFRGDSVFIQMPFFDSYFKALVAKEGHLKGEWVKRYADHEQVMPFSARHNVAYRFAPSRKPLYNASGRWDVCFLNANGDSTKAVGEFVQQGHRVSGTFLTATGDYRYLEGVVSGDSLLLSGFDGGHAFLFTARLDGGAQIRDGRFYNGIGAVQTWTGGKNATVALPSGYEETKMREGESRLNFRFKSLEGDTIAINDERFRNKVVLVQILGSWCPNCMDETKFLSEYYQRNKEKGFEVVALAYERTTDFEQSKKALQRFQQRFAVGYPILVTGVTVSDPQRSEKTLPQLAGIKAFPTSIFIDKNGVVRKIHSGFSGPGTGAHYEAFQKEFDATVSALLQE